MSYQSFNAFPRGEMKWKARQALTGHWLVAVLITALLMLFNNAANYAVTSMTFPGMTPMVFLTDPMSVMTEQAVLQIRPEQIFMVFPIAIFAGLLVNGVYQLAMTMYYMDLAQNNPNAGLSDFFGHFSEGLRGVGMFLWQALWIYLWSILFMLPGGAVFGAGMAMSAAESTMGGVVASFGVALMVAGMVGVVYKSLQYTFCFYALADEPSMGVRKALRASIEVTRGHIGEVLMLYLSFVGWMLLTMFPFVSLYVTPYMTSTFAQAWLHLRDRALESGRLAPDMFGLVAVNNGDVASHDAPIDVTPHIPESVPHDGAADMNDRGVETLEQPQGKDDKNE